MLAAIKYTILLSTALTLALVLTFGTWVLLLEQQLPFDLPEPAGPLVRAYFPDALPPLPDPNAPPPVLPPEQDPLTLPPEDPFYFEFGPMSAAVFEADGTPQYLMTFTPALVLRSPDQRAFVASIEPRLRDRMQFELMAAANWPRAIDQTGRVDIDYITRRLLRAAKEQLGDEYVWDLLLINAAQREPIPVD
jgi:hypothetical protein